MILSVPKLSDSTEYQKLLLLWNTQHQQQELSQTVIVLNGVYTASVLSHVATGSRL